MSSRLSPRRPPDAGSCELRHLAASVFPIKESPRLDACVVRCRTTSPKEARSEGVRERREGGEMEMESRVVEQPPAKRMRLEVPVRDGVGGGGGVLLPRSLTLRQILLVVLFLVRASARVTVTASVSQIGVTLDRTLRKYVGVFYSKLDSLQRQVEGLHQEVRQLARLHSNHHPERHTRLEPNQEHAASSGSNTNIHLRFRNKWKAPIYTDKDITDENKVAIKVEVFEGDKMITTGPLSKAKIEILVLHGSFYKKFHDNWTEEEFDKHTVQGRDGQMLVLGTVQLTNGGVDLSQIHFKEGSCRKKFSMAARFCKTEKIAGRVREAIMEPVEVKDRRNESNEKSKCPRLDDAVYRIEGIARDGAYHKRLQEANIHTVQDFLKALNKDSEELYKILKMKNDKSWSKMTGHARKCVLEDRHELKAYQTEDGTSMLFFNCVHDLVGARFGSSYISCEQFDINHKASVKRLKEHVYNRLEDIPYDYVMKGNAPERISLGTGAAAGPSVVSVDARQPNSIANNLEAYQDHQVDARQPNSIANNLEAYQDYQGAGAPENCPSDVFNLVTEPIDTYAYGPMYTDPLNTYDCQAPQMAWTPAQPSFPEQAYGPSCSLFPGSGHGNDW